MKTDVDREKLAWRIFLVIIIAHIYREREACYLICECILKSDELKCFIIKKQQQQQRIANDESNWRKLKMLWKNGIFMFACSRMKMKKKSLALFPMHSLVQPHLQFKGFMHYSLFDSATFQCLLCSCDRDEKYWNYRISILEFSFSAQKYSQKKEVNNCVHECSFVLNIWHPLLPTSSLIHIQNV